jgi:ankyrin repeat protein
MNALHVAASQGHLSLIDKILALGADINALNDDVRPAAQRGSDST